MNDLKQTIKDIRPSLRIVAPLTFYIILGYSLFSLILGVSYNFVQERLPEMQIVGIFNIKQWSIIFAFYSIVTLILLALNDWNNLKKWLVVGILVKGFWLFQLISVAISHSSLMLMLSVFVWTMFLYLQILTYIYFTPKKEDDSI